MRCWKYLALPLAASLTACPPVDVPPPPPSPSAPAPTGTPEPAPVVTAPFSAVSDDALTTLAKGNNAFAADLLARISQARTGNYAVSPASISLALAMTHVGARDETAAQMSAVLHLPSDSANSFGTLLRSWKPANNEYELRVANRLFGAQSLTFDDAFTSITGDHFLAPLERLDFTGDAEASREHINGWVEKQTNERIQDLLPTGSVKPDTMLVLANAVYFNGTWVDEFDAGATQPKDFHAPSGVVQVPTMHDKTRTRYAEADGNQIVQRFYRGGSIEMTVVVPRDKQGVAATEKLVSGGKLDAWTAAMKMELVELALPKFKIAGDSISLKDTLVAMGMSRPFDESAAQFGGMVQNARSPFISDVVHKAFVDVHEKGTEAAAATGVVMRPTSAMLPKEPKTVIADRPFLFFIRDAKTGSILFMGRVSDPSKT